MTASANPFRKEAFSSFREWEESLVMFLVEQLRQPALDQWQVCAVDQDARVNAAFTSLFLANLALCLGAGQEAELWKVFPHLMRREPQAAEFEEWFAQRWFDPSRLSNTLKFAAKHDLRKDTHRLLG